MRFTAIAPARLATTVVLVAALLWPVLRNTPAAEAVPPSGDYRRAVLVSWDGVKREVLLDLLEVSDPAVPCWNDGDEFPVGTGRVDAQGDPIFTCLPALGGGLPWDAPAGSPAYAPFQMLASHTTNDGKTMTKPQHASMLTGLNTETHGIIGNETGGKVGQGLNIYDKLMDAFDPLSPEGDRNGLIFRTFQSSDRKYVGRALYHWSKRNGALQRATGHGNGKGTRPGPLRKAEKIFERWQRDAEDEGVVDIDFFAFLHFKTPDWSGHRSGDDSRGYRKTIVQTDRKLYTLMEMLRENGWEDAAILVTTDHGFHNAHHTRNGGRDSFNTWLAAYNVNLSVDHIPMRTPEDYCQSTQNPADCLANGPNEPMPPEDVVPNVYVTSIAPTLLDMFGVEWQTTSGIEGVSLYVP